MTRSDEPLFEPRIADWLEDDPYTAPDQALDVVLAAFPSIKQRRASRVPWRVPGMNTPLRLGLAAAAAVAVAIGGMYVLNRGPSGPGGPGGPTPSATPAPTASPSPSPSPSTALLDPSTWTIYTSSRYGFSIAHPADWTEVPADHDWTLAADVDWLTNGAEAFFTTVDEGVRMTAWSVATEPGTTVDAWLQAYCPLTMVNTGDVAEQCATIIGKAAAATMDGHAGLLVVFPTDTQGFFLVEDRLYIVAIWRPETDPSVVRYSGTRRLVETFISTMRLLPGGPAPASIAPPS